MKEAAEPKMLQPRMKAVSWGIWAERAVVRALEIAPDNHIQAGLLFGQPTSHVALTIARAVGYLAGTQRAPDLPPPIRAWLDQVGMNDSSTNGARLGGLSWSEWAERAAVVALEIDPELKVEGPTLQGQDVWEVAITIARAVACLAGARRAWGLPVEIGDWLQGAPRLAMSEHTNHMHTEEETR